MAKITLNDLTTNYGSQTLHNTNNGEIESHLNNKVLYRDNPTGEPNQMENELDMNSNKITNLADGISGKDAVNVNQINALSSGSYFTTATVRPIDTVADIRTTDLDGYSSIQTLGYSEAGDGGGALYRADTSDASSSDDGFLVIVSNDGVRFKLQYDGYINLAAAGLIADWDGSSGTDNATKMQAALNSIPALSGAYLPPGKYRSTSKITVPNGIDFIMDGYLIYDGPETSGALEIGDNSSSIIRQKFVLRVWNKEQLPGTWTNDAHIGIKIWHANTCEIYVEQCMAFTTALQLESASGIGSGYNKIFLGHLSNNKKSVRLVGNTAGWVNENKFFGGRFSIDSTTNTTIDRLGIEIISEDSTYRHNSNVFYGFSCELSGGAGGATNTGTLADIHDGIENQFLQYRNEVNDDPEVIVRNDSRDNVFKSSFGGVNINDLSSQPSSTAISARDQVKAYTRASWNSGHLGRLATNYDGATGSVMLPTCDMWASSAALFWGGYSIADNDFIETTSARGIGRAFDTTFAKKWLVRRNVVDGFGGRIQINAYDASGTPLTGSSPSYVTGTDGKTLTYRASYGGGYATGGDAEEEQYFNLHPDVASIDVILTTGSAALKLKSFEVVALDMQEDKAITPFFRSTRPEEEERFATVVPTSGTYEKGTKIWQISPTSGSPMGFACSVAGSPGTWINMANYA